MYDADSAQIKGAPAAEPVKVEAGQITYMRLRHSAPLDPIDQA